MSTTCPLCTTLSQDLKLTKATGEKYRDCRECGLIFLEQKFHFTPEKELAHYHTHNNDVNDPGYQNFVSPIVSYILDNFRPGALGLDFGAGPGPVITYLLEQQGLKMSLYDPFFAPSAEPLSRQYDFVVACEVIEHFHSPAKEFKQLKGLLRGGGALAMMTFIYDDQRDFEKWHYHRDPTHVVFYRMKTFEWIKERFNFRDLQLHQQKAIILLN